MDAYIAEHRLYILTGYVIPSLHAGMGFRYFVQEQRAPGADAYADCFMLPGGECQPCDIVQDGFI